MELNALCRDVSRLTLWSAVMGVNLHPLFLSGFILLFCMCNLLFICLCARLVDATVRILCPFISALTYRLLSNIPIVVELDPLCQYLLVLPCPCVADEMARMEMSACSICACSFCLMRWGGSKGNLLRLSLLPLFFYLLLLKWSRSSHIVRKCIFCFVLRFPARCLITK